MSQSFAKKNSFTAVQLNNMCKFYSDIITLTGGAGDKTVNLPFDWTGGTLEIEISTSTSVYEGGATYFIYKTTYDALTSAGYTSNQISAAINSSGILTALTKSTNTSGMPKSATTTSFTLDDDGTTVYVKYRVWAPYTATIQMDGSNIILSGSGAPATTPQFIGQSYLDTTAKREYRAYGTSSSADWLKVPVYYSGTTTITNADVTITLPWDWSGGTVEIHKNTTEAYYFGNSDSIIRTSYISLTSATYTGDHLLYTGPINTVNVLPKSTDNNGSPKSATSTSFTLDNNGVTTYIKYFVWA